MAAYTFNKGDEVSFLDQTGSGTIVRVQDDGLAIVMTEEGFEMPFALSNLVPRFDLLKSNEVERKVDKVKGPIQEMGGFRLGMKAQVIDRTDRGEIISFSEKGIAKLEFENLFIEEHEVSKLIAIDEDQLKSLEKSVDDVRLSDIGEEPKPMNSQRSLKDRKDQGAWEVDLHVQELIDNSHGMMKHEIVQMQLDHFDKKLNEAIDKGVSKVIFIHGRGEGRLRTAIREILKRYANCEFLDADYQRYGVGATEVRIKFRMNNPEED